MKTAIRSIRVRAVTGALLAASVMPTVAHATGYLQIPSLPGETESKKDSGEAHLDYLTITLTNAKPNTSEAHSAGDEHEITYDVSAGGLMAKQKVPSMAGIAWGTMTARPADTAHGSRLTGIRAHKPARASSANSSTMASASRKPSRDVADRTETINPIMTASASWRACEVGASYDHILLGDGKGKEFRLNDVTVARCGREQVSFSYQRIGD